MDWFVIIFCLIISLATGQSISRDSRYYLPSRISSILFICTCVPSLKKLERRYEEKELWQETRDRLQELQIQEQTEHLGTRAESLLADEDTERELNKQIKQFQAILPILQKVFTSTDGLNPVAKAAIGMLQNGAGVGDVMLEAANMELRLKELEMQQNRELREHQAYLAAQQSQIRANQSQTPSVSLNVPAPVEVEAKEIKKTEVDTVVETKLLKAAGTVNLPTKLLDVRTGPSHKEYVFHLPVEHFDKQARFKQAAGLVLGKDTSKLPCFISGQEQLTFSVGLSPEERTFQKMPEISYQESGRKVVLGFSIDGEVAIDLADEDIAQVLVAGTTGSGKSELFRIAVYQLLKQGCVVKVLGGKVSDFEGLAKEFPELEIENIDETESVIASYDEECQRRKNLSVEELAQLPPWVAFIDEYKNTVPFENSLKKIYDKNLSSVIRLGRGLKIHVFIGLQKLTVRSQNDPQGVPPDIKGNLPCRIALRVSDANDGRLILGKAGAIAASLGGKGDAVIQTANTFERFQTYYL